MTDLSESQTKIEETINSLERSYAEAVKTVNMLKGRINMLEQARVSENSVESRALRMELDSVVDRLDRFVDSWILEVKDAWSMYRVLEEELLAAKGSDLEKLSVLKNLCGQSEQLVKDLLCYSLAHLRRAES